jgi:tetratricopeptide (TPR) repeat protein
MIRALFGIILLSLVSARAFCFDPDNDFRKGVEYYSNEQFSEAAGIWMELYNSGYDNYELLYNTGNAWFKLNEIPMAILFYERALLRKPGDEDTRYNLSVANGLIKDRYEVIPRIFITRWFNHLALLLPSDSWAIFAVCAFVSTLLLALLYLFAAGYKVKVASFTAALLLFIFSAMSLLLSFRSREMVYRNEEAIIITPVVTGKSGPSDGGTDLFVIHEGLKVRAGEKIGDWYEIRLPDGNKGWVPANTIEKI